MAGIAPSTLRPVGRGRGAGIARAGNIVAGVVGVVAMIALCTLTLSIVLGIVLRWVGIDNSWTYDLDLFSLVWVAFAGAVLTSRFDLHVTSGIALERMVDGPLRVALRMIRLALVVGFLVLLAWSGWVDTLSSYTTGETTIDVVQWSVWIAKAALPFGAAFWALTELTKAFDSSSDG